MLALEETLLDGAAEQARVNEEEEFLIEDVKGTSKNKEEAAGGTERNGESVHQESLCTREEDPLPRKLSNCARCVPVMFCLPTLSKILRRKKRMRQETCGKGGVRSTEEMSPPEEPIRSSEESRAQTEESSEQPAPLGVNSPMSLSSAASSRSESLRTLKSSAWEGGLRCIRSGDAEMLASFSAKSEFQSAIKVWRNRAGESILHVLCRNDSSPVLKQILEDLDSAIKNFLINGVRERERGMLPLHTASATGNAECVKLLLEHGALAKDQFDRYGLTPLHRASTASSVPLHNSAPPSTRSWNSGGGSSSKNASSGRSFHRVQSAATPQSTPTSSISGSSSGECAAMLLAAGADPFIKDHAGYTSWHKACFHGNVAVLKALVNHVDSRGEEALLAEEDLQSGIGGKTGMHLIAKYVTSKSNAVSGISLLASRQGFDVNALCNADGLTPLHEASIIGNREAVLALLAAGADINRVAMRGETALHMAIAANQVDVVECLLMDGRINLSATDKDGHTPKGAAVRQGSLEIVELLNSKKLARVREADRVWKEELEKQKQQERLARQPFSPDRPHRSSLTLTGAIDSLFSRSSSSALL